MFNSVCFSGTVAVGATAIGALFCKQVLQPGQRVARYTGRAIHDASWNSLSTSKEYLLKATSPRTKKHVTLDGNPVLYDNLGGYANHVVHKHANAMFSDDADEAPDGEEHWVWIVAKEFIESGQEIRVDYDRGARNTPFQTQMLKQGVPKEALTSANYKKRRVVVPKSFSGYKHAEDPVEFDSDDDESILERVVRKKLVELPRRPRGRAPRGMRWDPIRGFVYQNETSAMHV